ncbi:MAG: DUF86 domain-containing protein [Actinobacteria bacterium]|nr:DUF86 domain-containing protein [Actinomycetota bacterium]
MRGKRGERERLLDILEAVDAIRTHVTSRHGLDDPVAAAAATHWIEIIGEAVNGLSSGVRDHHPDVAWQDAIRMRNRLVHGYFDIDLDLLWDTIERDVPMLAGQILSILDTLSD